MTGRGRLDRRLRWVSIAVFSAVALTVVPAVAAQALGVPLAGPWALLPGGVFLTLAVMSGHYVVLRCPWCRGNLGGLLMDADYWRVDPKVQYCPYCRCDFDWELTATARPGGTT